MTAGFDHRKKNIHPQRNKVPLLHNNLKNEELNPKLRNYLENSEAFGIRIIFGKATLYCCLFMGALQIDSNELPATAGTSRYLPPAAPSVAVAQPLRRSRHGQSRLKRTLPEKKQWIQSAGIPKKNMTFGVFQAKTIV